MVAEEKQHAVAKQLPQSLESVSIKYVDNSDVSDIILPKCCLFIKEFVSDSCFLQSLKLQNGIGFNNGCTNQY